MGVVPKLLLSGVKVQLNELPDNISTEPVNRHKNTAYVYLYCNSIDVAKLTETGIPSGYLKWKHYQFG